MAILRGDMDFSGKTALVLGGTAGIGLAAARGLAAGGANVVIAGLDNDEGRATAAALGDARALFAEVDVSQENEVEAIVVRTAERFGRIDIAINNAGTSGTGRRVQDATSEEFDRLVAINLKGVWLGLKYQVRHMLGQGGGVIVNTSSTAGLMSLPYAAIYSATKHAVIGLTKAAAIELAPKNIRINAVAPGGVKTALFEQANSRVENGADKFAERVPLGRIGSPEEIAEGILWLASDHSRYATGHTLVLDGGFSLI